MSDIQLPMLSNTRLPPMSDIQLPMSDIQLPMSDIQLPMSDIQLPMSDIQLPMSDIQLPMSDIQLPMSDIQLPMSDIQLPMLSNIRLPPNVRHSTAVECQAVLPFFTRDQIYPPIPIAANSHTPRTSVMKYFRNSASRSSSGITDMLSKIVNP